MNNIQMCEEIQKAEPQSEYVADEMVKAGNGQKAGGYIDLQGENTLQKDHFLRYYNVNGKEKITYQYLRCPQLILFIAEFVGVPKNVLKEAKSKVEEYDEKYDINPKSVRNGNYMWGKNEFRDFKKSLQFGTIIKIIKKEDTIKQVREKVRKKFE